MAATSIVWFEPVVSMIKFRFFSSFTAESDSVRMIQIERLLEGIKEKPLFGYGMGSYLPDYIRSNVIPFSYEAEYLSFIYQLGILGFVVLIGGNIAILLVKLFPYLKVNDWLIKAISILGFGWYLIRPVFNPTFLGLQNGFPIIGILLFNVYCANKCTKKEML